MSTPIRRRVPVQEPESAAGFGRLVREHRAGLAALAVAAAAVGGAWYAWSKFGEEAAARPDSVLFPERITVEGLGPWVVSDLKTEALRNASLDGGLPLADAELPQRLERAFLMHPWVCDVRRVELRHPAAAVVEVQCREPVAMVAWQGGLLAVDSEGVVLPSADFTPESATGYPKVTGIDSSPLGLEGTRWGDPAVDEAAAVAAAIGPEWRGLELREIRPVTAGGRRTWELVAADRRVFVFGAAPGREPAGEPLAAIKIGRLRTRAAAAGEGERVDLTADDHTADDLTPDDLTADDAPADEPPLAP